MAGYKETPRQKMIGMMYLVLTALLALNVSKEILESFIVVNESIETTTQNFSAKLQDVYADFARAASDNPEKVREYQNKALVAQRLADEMTAYIDSIKWAVIIATDNKIETVEQAKSVPLGEIASRDKYTEPTRFFFGRSPDGTNATAGDLRRAIEKFKGDLLNLVDPKYRENIKIGLDTEGPFFNADGRKQTWEQHNFYYSILAADVTILNKLINEVRNAEFDVIKHLYAAIDAEDFKFDKVAAKVIPKSSYVLKGDNYEAEVLVAAYDSKSNPDVVFAMGTDTLTEANRGNAKPVEGAEGVVKISIPAGALGIQKYAGIINVQSPLGGTIPYHFKGEYIVGEPSLTVSAKKMNVFYIGVDNPVSISVPGIPSEKLKPSISAGRLTSSGGEWIVRVDPGTSKATINVSADIDGGVRSMGSADFRVKRVPDPQATVAGRSSGLIAKSALTAAGGIIPKMPDDFEFELYFEIVSFSFVTVKSGDIFERTGRGNRFSPEMQSLIDGSQRGTKIWIENIVAKGPDGNRQLGTISLQIQ